MKRGFKLGIGIYVGYQVAKAFDETATSMLIKKFGTGEEIAAKLNARIKERTDATLEKVIYD